MNASLRFSTSCERTPCLASSAEVARPAAPAPTISTGTCSTFIAVSLQTELTSSVRTPMWHAAVQCATTQQLSHRCAGERQQHVFEHSPDIDPVDRPSGDHPQHVEAQCDVGDQAQVAGGRTLPASA